MGERENVNGREKITRNNIRGRRGKEGKRGKVGNEEERGYIKIMNKEKGGKER